MQSPQVDPQLFNHIRVLISLVAGMGLTRLLTGVARIIQHPGKKKVYWVHLGWALWMFLALINFWWWEFRLAQLHDWKFVYYVFLIVYATVYFLLCALLFPDNLDEYAGYRDYFMSRRAWIFGALATLFVLDLGDTLIKGAGYFAAYGIEYPLRAAIHVALCLMAMRSANPRFQAASVILALAYQASWILRHFETFQ
ncbi:hypothetical protein [Solilutibacter silvestris]|uniref:Transmembrane protein n=1 Tax=Solilutibacter silvestris TaxID=1645665 RepID=A0A2K1PY56_9GAMM|nr:hypothetical protein [Lysobacter silvestris]PNS07711.1 hypothetical protein Lysil_1887 [Lysobacter silvestris]